MACESLFEAGVHATEMQRTQPHGTLPEFLGQEGHDTHDIIGEAAQRRCQGFLAVGSAELLPEEAGPSNCVDGARRSPKLDGKQ